MPHGRLDRGLRHQERDRIGRNVVLVAPNGPVYVLISGKTFNPFVHADLPRDGILMLANEDQGTLMCEEDSIREHPRHRVSRAGSRRVD